MDKGLIMKHQILVICGGGCIFVGGILNEAYNVKLLSLGNIGIVFLLAIGFTIIDLSFTRYGK